MSRSAYAKKKTAPPSAQPGTAHVPLTKGLYAVVDESDYKELSAYNWHASHWGYAVRMVRKEDGKQTAVFMHRQLVGPRPGFEVDHINRNRLDNRRCNLRECTHSENQRNKNSYGGKRKG